MISSSIVRTLGLGPLVVWIIGPRCEHCGAPPPALGEFACGRCGCSTEAAREQQRRERLALLIVVYRGGLDREVFYLARRAAQGARIASTAAFFALRGSRRSSHHGAIGLPTCPKGQETNTRESAANGAGRTLP